ncbi:hypothetical protein [Trueperella pyogenes]|uniref:hypothetical protein n=1 Tax=Trueperella pyogenes TaxID=1661 RepID=UPI0038733855
MKKKYRKVAIGVDVGGSGIKGAPVDLKTGQFIDKRLRIPHSWRRRARTDSRNHRGDRQ